MKPDAPARRKKKRMDGKGFLVNAVILLASALVLLPLFWIVITAMKSQVQVLKQPLALFPQPNMFIENLKEVWRRADWLLFYKNTIVLTASVWTVQMLVAIPAGFAFGVLKAKGMGLLFLLVLTRLVVSPESTMLANYLTVLGLGAYNTLAGIVMPYVVSAQAIFIFRQGFKSIPPSYRESAALDGCGDFWYMLRIGVPLIKSHILSFSIITCVFQWNAFFWPMLITQSPDKRILPVAMTYFGLQAESGSEWGLTMMATLIVAAPLLLAFFLFQKKFINSFISSGIR